MKTNNAIKTTLAALACMALLGSCSKTIDGGSAIDPGQTIDENARVVISVPHRTKTAAAASARAVGYYVDRVVLTALNEAGAAVASETTVFDQDREELVVGINVPTGVPLRIKAEIFNLAMSETVSNVNGFSRSVTMEPNKQVLIGITCLPTEPIAVSPEAVVSLGTDVYNNFSEVGYPSHIERWLSFVAGSGTHSVLEFTVQGKVKAVDAPLTPVSGPISLGRYRLSASVYDETGTKLDDISPDTTDTGYRITVPTVPGKKYYLLPGLSLWTGNDTSITGPLETECRVALSTISVAEDQFEPNDTQESAAVIQDGVDYTLTLTDDDWYKLVVEDYSTLSVLCENGNGAISFRLIMPDGSSAWDPQGIVVETGTYYIQVFGSPSPAPYALRCDISAGPEDSSGNASPAAAFDLTDLDSLDKFTLGGHADWYVISLGEPSNFSIQPVFESPKQEESYTVTLYDSGLNELYGPKTYGTTWSPTLGVSERLLPGTYYFRIESAGGHPSYKLDMSVSSLDSAFSDSSEQNDTAATAATLTNCGAYFNTSLSRLQLADEDWFTCTPSKQSSLKVNFSVVPLMTPEVTVYDSAMNELYVERLSQWAVIGYTFNAGQKYFVRVRPIWASGEAIVNYVVGYDLSLY
jgi:hypothetical protein